MNNYQLHRTNLLLGGQMKWDLIIDSAQNTLYVSDFHLTPISNNVSHTYKLDEYLLKNTHQDNVKAYYNANKGTFYAEGLDADFSHSWPVIADTNGVLYSKTYDAGCKRTKLYDTYKKQFELFCPLWLEHITGDISFTISILSTNANTVLASNTLILASNEINKYHDTFIQYFNNYVCACGLDAGSDDVLNISFKNNAATITGLNASNGIFETINCDTLVDNIIARERSVMETDNIIISTFADNSMICKQLFNFNLCFDIDDIISGSIANMLKGEPVLVSVTVKIGDDTLEQRDFYTEYEFINKDISARSTYNTTHNVLEYLHDYECVDLVDKNKFCQPICHWSLCDNNEYIFNVYDGYSGLYVDINHDTNETTIYENEHQYGMAPNLVIKKHDKNQNPTGWISSFQTTLWSDVYKYIKNPAKYRTHATRIGKDAFINNVRYNYVPQFENGAELYVMGIAITDKLLASITSAIDCYDLTDEHNIYAIYNEEFKLVIFLTNNYDYLTFGHFLDILSQINEQLSSDVTIDAILLELYKMMKSYVEPTIVTFNQSVQYCAADSPDIHTSEIEYIKTNEFNYVTRYDGKVKPTFTDRLNTIYYKELLTEDVLKTSAYSKYNNLGFEPLYPSIGYCAIKKLNEWSRDTHFATTDKEYSWFNNSRCLILLPELKFTYVNSPVDGVYKPLDTIVLDLIADTYGITDMATVNYIKNLYTYSNNWEYYSDTNISDYVYQITMKLK